MSADDSQVPPSSAGRRPVDPVALQRIARRLAQSTPEPWLHLEVARRMAERLPLIKARPETVLVWGGTGQAEIESAYAAADPGARKRIDFWPVEPTLHGGEPDAVQPDSETVAAHGKGGEGGKTGKGGKVGEGSEGGKRGKGGEVGEVGEVGKGVSEPGGRFERLLRWLGLDRLAKGRPQARVGLPLRPGQVPAASVGMVWSNMGLHLQPDPLAAFRHWHRALALDGFIMFSTLGPGSLPELRHLYARAGWGPAMAPLVDMHDLGDMLVQAGFADPVMDQETLVLDWPDAESALRELRTLGANADPRRCAGLRSRHWREQLRQALQATASSNGRVALSFEIAYGHAFRPPERARLQPETRIALQDMRSMVRLPSGSGRGLS